MNNLFYWLILVSLFISCNKSDLSSTKIQDDPAEVLDIRVFSDYQVVVNGESTSYYLLNNYLKEVNIDSLTKTRVFFHEDAAMGLMKSLQKFFRDHEIQNPSIAVFSKEELNRHISTNIYIDILSKSNFLFNGKEIHPENLTIALRSNFNPDSTTIYLNHYQPENSDELIESLKKLGFKDIFLN